MRGVKNLIRWHRQQNRESGQVSILTVTMFILLFSVLVVSFTRIMVSVSRQAANDELHASAMSAAEAGIEDAKRIVDFCRNKSAGSTVAIKDACQKVLGVGYGSNDCTSVIENLLKNNPALSSSLQFNEKQVKVGDEDREHYLCLQIKSQLSYYKGVLDPDQPPVIVPLKFANATAAATVSLEWHDLAKDKDGAVSGFRAGDDLPKKSDWTAQNYPTTVRLELVRIPKSFTLSDITNTARAVTLRPSNALDGCSGASPSCRPSGTFFDMDYWKQSENPNDVKPALFKVGGASGDSYCKNTGQYACKFTFSQNIGGVWKLDLQNYDYYLRLDAIYRKANFNITAKGLDGSQLLFDGVQSEVDVTGRSQDAFRRVSAIIEASSGTVGNPGWFPPYAIESGADVCKKMSVMDNTGTDECSY